jgi:hypothetical protein
MKITNRPLDRLEDDIRVAVIIITTLLLLLLLP